MHIFNPLVLTD